MAGNDPAPKFFRTPQAFGNWLRANHNRRTELWVGYYKKDSGRPSITWPESVDEALCWGWIDGLRKNIDEVSYKIRFTPRKPTSIWSRVNLGRARRLIEEGKMEEPGLRAFRRKKARRTGVYAREQQNPRLDPALDKRFRAKKKAFSFFEAQPPGYRRIALAWIMNAKRPETRARRLDQLIEACAREGRLPQLGGRPTR